MQDPGAWPALFLEQDDTGTYKLDDGHHRLAAAKLLNLQKVPIKWMGSWKDLCQQFPRSYRAGLLRLAFDDYQPKHK